MAVGPISPPPATLSARARPYEGGHAMSRAIAFVELFGVVGTLAVAACTSAALNDRPSGATTGTSGQGTGSGSSGDWCAALGVFRDNCQMCHAAQPLYGAPMPLVTIDNLRAQSVTNPSKHVYEMVELRIHD